jgi:glycosidase
MTVGECWGATPEIARLYTAPERKELSMIFQFEQIQLDKKKGGQRWDLKELDLRDLKAVFSKWQYELEECGWNSLFWSNHDLPRIVSRWGNDREYRELSAKMLATLLHGMKGTPYIYQGEELGMTNAPFTSIEDFPDIETQNIYKERLRAGFSEEETMCAIRKKARDNARTPMQWNAEKNAGFTTGTPWYQVNPNYTEINAEDAMSREDSVFYYYQKLIRLRREHEIMAYGIYDLLLPEDEDLYIYTRTLENEKWLILCNFHEKERVITSMRMGRVILSNYADTPQLEELCLLRPYEAVIYQISGKKENIKIPVICRLEGKSVRIE